ncbi:Growth-regulating factor 12 [Acorus gramineus]|uniref:Growth-regulating factor n=1 Tax=Acorus gramineus TaxID=55184 RepID=A0AAV9BDZ9_ACOGR|nr:Growth-regulating factor 12 [Acorus gramineus]
MLGLGLGLGLGPGKSGFTFLQLQELEHQALIFKYMVASVPVPFHLVLPIWKSVAGSSYHNYFPSFMMGCGDGGGLWYDHKTNSTEAEPGRCRRTDGKKWRCSKDVVPDQKYCERHMHRGRLRSRKPVEPPSSSSSPFTTTTTTNSNSNLSISIPTGLQLMTSSSASTTTSMNNGSIGNSGSSSRLGFSPTSVLQSSICKTDKTDETV